LAELDASPVSEKPKSEPTSPRVRALALAPPNQATYRLASRFGTLKQSTAEEANIHGLSFTRVSHARDFPIFAFIKFGYAYDYLAVITSQDATMR